MKVGVHTSIASGLENAAQHAKKIGCDTFQVFSANPRGWQATALAPDGCFKFRAARERHQLAPVVIHDNYLINLAAADPAIRKKSIAAFRGELLRATALGADYLVTHPGSSKGTTARGAIATCIESLKEAADGLRLNGLMILIENTAGQGSVLGRTFDELAEIVRGAGCSLPAGACVDTAHCFAAGYPIHTREGLEQTLLQLDSSVSLESVRIIHANDSKTAFNSHNDRHEHIGKGYIGAEAFGRIVGHPKLRAIPFICETPLDRPGDDKRNIRMLRKLAGEENPETRRQKAGSRVAQGFAAQKLCGISFGQK
ncbi:MAG: deoxyribonuclease IV [Terriglobia bacterium]